MFGKQHYPQLSLTSVPVDEALARRLPLRLAHYYLALPIAEDADGLSVVMAHPEDGIACQVLEGFLNSPITPIQGAADEIRAALVELWKDNPPDQSAGVLYWSHQAASSSKKTFLLKAVKMQMTYLDSRSTDLDTAVQVAHEGGYSLLIVDATESVSLPRLARISSVPVLILPNEPANIHKILLVLRGHAPDDIMLDWVTPLAQATNASITLLVVATPILPFYTREIRRFQGLMMLLDPDSSIYRHIEHCAERLSQAGVPGVLKLRHGSPRQQIADELADGNYDLVAIAAEAHGDFVEEVFVEVEGRALHTERAFMIAKPTLS